MRMLPTLAGTTPSEMKLSENRECVPEYVFGSSPFPSRAAWARKKQA